MKFSKSFAMFMLGAVPSTTAFQPPRHFPSKPDVSPLSYVRADDPLVDGPLVSDAVDRVDIRESFGRRPPPRTLAIEPMGGFDRDAPGQLMGSIYSGYQQSYMSGPKYEKNWVGQSNPSGREYIKPQAQDVFTEEPIHTGKPAVSNHHPAPSQPLKEDVGQTNDYIEPHVRDVFTAEPMFIRKPEPAFRIPVPPSSSTNDYIEPHARDIHIGEPITRKPAFPAKTSPSKEHYIEPHARDVFMGEPITREAAFRRPARSPSTNDYIEPHARDVFMGEPITQEAAFRRPARSPSTNDYIEPHARDIFMGEPLYIPFQKQPLREEAVTTSRDDIFTADTIYVRKPPLHQPTPNFMEKVSTLNDIPPQSSNQSSPMKETSREPMYDDPEVRYWEKNNAYGDVGTFSETLRSQPPTNVRKEEQNSYQERPLRSGHYKSLGNTNQDAPTLHSPKRTNVCEAESLKMASLQENQPGDVDDGVVQPVQASSDGESIPWVEATGFHRKL